MQICSTKTDSINQWTAYLKAICYLSWNLWYDSYYKHHLDQYSDWKQLYTEYLSVFSDKVEGTYGIWLLENNDLVGIAVITDKSDFKTISSSTDDKWLTDVFILPKWRNKGYGRNIINYATSVGCNRLSCLKDIAPLYESLGWYKIDLVGDWIIMTLDITRLSKPV